MAPRTAPFCICEVSDSSLFQSFSLSPPRRGEEEIVSSWPHLLSGLLIFDPGAWRGYYFFLSFRCVMAIVLCACNFFLRVTVGGNCLLAEAV